MKQVVQSNSIPLCIRLSPRANAALRVLAGHQTDSPQRQKGLGRLIGELVMQEYGRSQALAEQRDPKQAQGANE